MGTGVNDEILSNIFRRVFASRTFPEIAEQLGMKHVCGILLYGPHGSGKTQVAKNICEMIPDLEPKIFNVSGFWTIGEIRAKIREVFADAEREQAQRGNASCLHIIVMDNNAICPRRLSGCPDDHVTIVYQLIAKMDGPEQLNNILVIGITSNKDMVDEALLRVGRMDVHINLGESCGHDDCAPDGGTAEDD